MPSLNSKSHRYCFDFDGIELDLSIRPASKPIEDIELKEVAINRAFDSDVGLSAVAIDPFYRAWAMPEYLTDQEQKTLTVYWGPDMERREIYAQRVQLKFPDYKIVLQSEPNVDSSSKAEDPEAQDNNGRAISFI